MSRSATGIRRPLECGDLAPLSMERNSTKHLPRKPSAIQSGVEPPHSKDFQDSAVAVS